MQGDLSREEMSVLCQTRETYETSPWQQLCFTLFVTDET